MSSFSSAAAATNALALDATNAFSADTTDILSAAGASDGGFCTATALGAAGHTFSWKHFLRRIGWLCVRID